MNIYQKMQMILFGSVALIILIIIVLILDLIGMVCISGKRGLRLTVIIYHSLPFILGGIVYWAGEAIFNQDAILMLLFPIAATCMLHLFFLYSFIRGNIQIDRKSRQAKKKGQGEEKEKAEISFAATAVLEQIISTVFLTLYTAVLILIATSWLALMSIGPFMWLAGIFSLPFFGGAVIFIFVYICMLYIPAVIFGINSALRLEKQFLWHKGLIVTLQFLPLLNFIALLLLRKKVSSSK